MTLPTDFPGLLYWYRGDNVTLNVNAVAAMLDGSNTADPNKNAVQPTAALQPTYNAVDPLYNNNPTVSFNTTQLLQSGTWITPAAQPLTRFQVCHSTVNAVNYAIDGISGSARSSTLIFGFVPYISDGGSLIPFGSFNTANTPTIIWSIDNGASSQISANSILAGATGNPGTQAPTGVTVGNNYLGTGGLQGTVAEAFAYAGILTQTQIAQLLGYLQQRYGIPCFGSQVTALFPSPTLADLVLAAQQRADRVNAGTITTTEWYSYVNHSAQELYGILTSTYEDYNIKTFAFSLVGGAQGQNQINVGPNTLVPDFFQSRYLWLQLNSSPQPFVTIPRLESQMERNRWTFPSIVPVYGAIPSRWNIMGSIIEVLPPSVAGASYVLGYVPTLPKLASPTDSISQFWLSVNGWDEYITLDAAAKALIKEESLDTAQLLLQQKMAIRERILREAAPRDISQPRSIVDMQAVRNPWGGWGAGGLPGPGWGADGTGTGCW